MPPTGRSDLGSAACLKLPTYPLRQGESLSRRVALLLYTFQLMPASLEFLRHDA